MNDKLILDPCCGSKMFWFEKNHPNVIYGDKRREEHTLCDGRSLVIDPDVLLDFTDLPFLDESFHLVSFDPPHIQKMGQTAWMAKKYGLLPKMWQELIGKGFSECMRVCKQYGTVIFKWNETEIKLKEVLAVIESVGHKPLFGHTTGRQSKTIWLAFMKL